MFKTKSLLLPVALAGIFPVSAAQAALVNGGFETGDFTSWIVESPLSAQVTTSATASSGAVYHAVEGTYFADLWGSTYMFQELMLNAGDMLSGWAAFLAHDYMPFNDYAFVWVEDDTGHVISRPFVSSVGQVGSWGASPWTAWRFVVPSTSRYWLMYGVQNALDSQFNSEAIFDATVLTVGPVPEPSTWIAGMLAVGLIGAARKFRS